MHVLPHAELWHSSGIIGSQESLILQDHSSCILQCLFRVCGTLHSESCGHYEDLQLSKTTQAQEAVFVPHPAHCKYLSLLQDGRIQPQWPRLHPSSTAEPAYLQAPSKHLHSGPTSLHTTDSEDVLVCDTSFIWPAGFGDRVSEASSRQGPSGPSRAAAGLPGSHARVPYPHSEKRALVRHVAQHPGQRPLHFLMCIKLRPCTRKLNPQL